VAVRPDFVIAGAAKCGTSALFHYLRQHPDVFMPELKEPGFFSTDMPGGIAALDEYLALFARAPRHALTGEGSTRYVYSHVAIEHLIAHNPRVKVIVMLRNPVDAARSQHGYAYRYRHEAEADFERAWRMQELRGRSAASHPVDYDYRATYLYAAQVRRVIRHVPAEQRLFLIYEEFFADPATHYARVLEFLGLPPLALAQFAVVNAAESVRSAGLERLARRPPGWLRALYRPVQPFLARAQLNPTTLLGRLNWSRQPKGALHPEFRAELEQYFAADVAELEQLLGRSLWYQGR